ncbi:MAG: hypothetical protein ACPGXL_00110 [Chitinophagales bacterium]
MKYFIFTLLTLFSIQSGYGQACYVHTIKYVGNVESGELEVIQVQLPNFHFSKRCSRKKNHSFPCWATTIPKNKQFEMVIRSDSFTKIYKNPTVFFDLFKANKANLPIVITIRDRNNEISVVELELPWKNLEMKTIEDGQIPNTFELDLKTITLNH